MYVSARSYATRQPDVIMEVTCAPTDCAESAANEIPGVGYRGQ